MPFETVDSTSPHDYDEAYDYALRNGNHNLAQYLCIGPMLRELSPANVLAIGGWAHAPLLMHAAFFADGGGPQAPIMIYLDDDLERLNHVQRMINDYGGIGHEIQYHPENLGALAVSDVVKNTDWDMIVIDEPAPKKLVQACTLAHDLKKDHTWVFAANCENRDVRKTAENVLGETEHVIRSYRRGAGGAPLWCIWEGEHGS